MPVHAAKSMATSAIGIGSVQRPAARAGMSSSFARPVAQRHAISTRMTVLMEAYKLVPCGDRSAEHMDKDYEDKPIPEFVIDKDEVVLGRDEEKAKLVLPVPTVSGAHAKIGVAEDDSGIVVTDLGSTNGTFVEGSQIEAGVATPVKLSQTVIFGDEHLAAFKVEAEAAAAAPEPTPEAASE